MLHTLKKPFKTVPVIPLYHRERNISYHHSRGYCHIYIIPVFNVLRKKTEKQRQIPDNSCYIVNYLCTAGYKYVFKQVILCDFFWEMPFFKISIMLRKLVFPFRQSNLSVKVHFPFTYSVKPAFTVKQLFLPFIWQRYNNTSCTVENN